MTMTRSSVGTRAAWIADPEADILLNAASDEDARADGPPARGGRLSEDRRLSRRRRRPRGAKPASRRARRSPSMCPGSPSRSASGEVRGPRRARRGRVGGEPRAGLDPYSVPRAPRRHPRELENGGKPLAIVCSAGNRSSIAASLLKRAGLDERRACRRRRGRRPRERRVSSWSRGSRLRPHPCYTPDRGAA